MDLPGPDIALQNSPFARDVLTGLGTSPKAIEPRWLYDTVGAKLFEAITTLDHYYVTRTELALIAEAANDIAFTLGEGVTIVEPGSGEALKVRPLLDALGVNAAGYVPIDIAADQLKAVASELGALYPQLAVTPVAADFFNPFTMPHVDNAVVFFPGSTIGNMQPEAARTFLMRLRQSTGASRVLIGFDLVKDRRVLLDAYDDPAGVTAAFAKNLLQRINRELDGTFDLSRFAYSAHYDEVEQRVVMGLRSLERQSVTVAGRSFGFADGEVIHTEDSRKFTVPGFAAFARTAGLEEVETWTDAKDYFALMLLDAKG
ncbi:L-histidine N(alpha)-methyltransferase [Acuticoccus sp. M5D2P5]|uniref:L-histidine N(alpha)-methyltransferase n=1 Tax=Acuticoccus kalidii TaxID=2910977 RepID=UPI001F249124|nr:L-histidine N(alpha)-methyltransferase [Acuticoccus kalidii]